MSAGARIFCGRSQLVLMALLTTLFHFRAEAVSIFEVRKRLAMTNDEVVPRDFYLNGGVESGLKPGMIVKVTRQVTPYDSYQNKSPGDLIVPVGELKVIFVQKGVSVARLHRIFDRSDLPILEDEYIMVGDEVDVGSARLESPSEKKKSAQGQPAPAEALPEKIEGASSASMAPPTADPVRTPPARTAPVPSPSSAQAPNPNPEVGSGTYLP